MEAKALGQLLDEKNQSLRLNCKSSQLFHLAFWTVYLLFLRTLGVFLRFIKLSPERLQGHILRTEFRIANIAVSIIQILPDRDISYSSFSKSTYRQQQPRQRDGSYEGSTLSTGPADDLMAPRKSSLESDYTPPAMFIHQPDMAYLRPQAPGPPYRRENFENIRPGSSLISHLPPGIHANGRHRSTQIISQSLDGTVSPPSFAEPIPQIPLPSIPAFIARMPFVSVSDSIYSSDSAQLPFSERKASAEARTYIDVLPKWSFEDSDGAHQVNPTSENDATNASQGNALGFPARIRTDAQLNTLAAVAQQYARMNYRRSRDRRSSSAPVVVQNDAKELED
ncbi:hypothetical protein TSTA_116280 [Talaromyces stipitatus ATCC 10500]|uniref:Uncharacterized protein n=1 Tax=Talaromyces stipitatus (strain ATCC 10500 / CBS 375.48 / QM 6759 / NRRL 1006) TaxID=441959 RepID=B8MBH4_TALSN|nr:uncharacterized protein TSTA_116280 [Talaromyces stipitatus ATCC 10500]EED17838.1 hypothetical protein TSTA_116280 [Talaromyces stipitatus ATCC 10500]